MTKRFYKKESENKTSYLGLKIKLDFKGYGTFKNHKTQSSKIKIMMI
jgi:hypothetical protein